MLARMNTRTDWFREAAYGLFIHWGPYSVGGRGEWIMNRERIPLAEYAECYSAAFKAERYDPVAWARLAREAGMGYVVLTTRHHDGFCLWDTATTPANAARTGPGRDLIAPYVAALRQEGLRVGFYYSVADWSHPDYPDAYARDWPQGWRDEAARTRFVAFYRAQLEELLTRYGKIDILWYDGAIPDPLDGAETNRRVRELQPDILINERLGDPCDFRNAEQALAPKDGVWEACVTLTSGSWGYHPDGQERKTPKQLLEWLIGAVKAGGNLLVNVGPRPDGTIPDEETTTLRAVGAWLQRNPDWFRSADRAPFSWFTSGALTCKGNHVYLHLLRWSGDRFTVAEVANRVLAARILATGQAVRFKQHADGRLELSGLPASADALCTTVALTIDGTPRALRHQSSFWIPG